ncbi:MAG: preprotein translocase subunit SecG [Nitrospiraceae bacterium]
MYTLAVVVHVMVCVLMIASILLQSGKGAEIGAAFGGSSQTVFGSRGPGTFLSKVTVAAAIVFMLTSLSLAVLSKERTFSSTVIDLNKQDSSGAPSHSGDAGHEAPDSGTSTPPAEPAKP